MRWQTADEGPAGLFPVTDLYSDEYGSGRMSNLEFLPVVAHKVLNHLPNTPWATWTINAYRGCSHACTYCLAADTPILTADGRSTRIVDLQVGDQVYGTALRGRYRRYTTTEVRDIWQTVRRAYRVRLADGTELICSGDHRFLTDQGWKHTADAPGTAQRPHLTTNNELLGFGAMATPPKHDPDYQRGYLTGMIRGDGHLGRHAYERPGRTNGELYRFRLALADVEALNRSRAFLLDRGICTSTFAFARQTEVRRPMTAIRTSSRAGYEAVSDVIAWPPEPSDEWHLGFLAGIFDAEGSHSRGILRISNGDDHILDRISTSLSRCHFPHVVEPPAPSGVRSVRILGGLSERLRFLLACDPAITRKRQIDGVAIKSAVDLRVVAVDDLGVDIPMVDIATGTGDFIANGVVSHNCFARPTHEYLGLNAGSDFDSKIVVKINAVDVLRKELAAPGWQRESVAMGTNTDPYQRAEAKFKITRGIIETLIAADTPFTILTKSPLVTRDLDLIAPAAQRLGVSVAFSIGTIDEHAWRLSEPGTPHPLRRVAAIRAMVEAGVPTSALMAPILPGLSDRPEQLAATARAIRDAGGTVTHAHPVYLRGATREHFMSWLREHDRALHDRYVRGLDERGDVSPAYRRWLRETLRRVGVTSA